MLIAFPGCQMFGGSDTAGKRCNCIEDLPNDLPQDRYSAQRRCCLPLSNASATGIKTLSTDYADYADLEQDSNIEYKKAIQDYFLSLDLRNLCNLWIDFG